MENKGKNILNGYTNIDLSRVIWDGSEMAKTKNDIDAILENKNIKSFFEYVNNNSVTIEELNMAVSHINSGIYIKTELSSENKELYYDNSDIKSKTSIIDRDQFETFLNNFRK